MHRINVICPVYREEEVIELFHERLSKALVELDQRYRIRITYVADPSPDRTETVLSGISARDERVEVLVMSRRFGHQAALVAGLERSDADAVIMLDSDLQHPPELIPRLVAEWQAGAEVVQTIRRDGPEITVLKRATSLWFYRILLWFRAIDLPVGASDYRLLSRRVVEVFRAELPEQNPFRRGLVAWVGYKVANVPFVPVARTVGRSNYRATTLINFALNGLCSFSKLPLRFCIGLGLAVSALSFIGGGVELVLYLMGTFKVPGWPSLIAALCFLGGHPAVLPRRHRGVYRPDFRRGETATALHH